MRNRRGATWRELVVVLFIVTILVALIFPAMQKAREDARRSTCKNNLKQLGISLHNYHEANTVFPPLRTGTAFDCDGHHGNYSDHWSGSSNFDPANGDRGILSGFYFLLPYQDCSPFYGIIAEAPCQGGDPSLPARMPNALPHQVPPDWYGYDRPDFVCPSSQMPERDSNTAGSHRSYCFSIGDQYRNVNSVTKRNRGVFSPYACTSISEIADGTSNTIAMAERDMGRKTSKEKPGRVALWSTLDPTVPGGCHNNNTGAHALLSKNGRHYNGPTVVDPDRGLPLLPGEQWANGLPFFSAVMIVTPPNSPSCTKSGPFDDDMLISVSSRHGGGAHVLFADGAVKFLTDVIDTTRPASDPGESRFGLWGALGSMAGREVTEDDLEPLW